MLEMNYVAQHRALLTPSQSLPWKLCFQHLPKDMKIKPSHPACCYFSPSCFIFIFKKGIWALFPSLQSFGTSPWAQTFSSLLHPPGVTQGAILTPSTFTRVAPRAAKLP